MDIGHVEKKKKFKRRDNESKNRINIPHTKNSQEKLIEEELQNKNQFQQQ